MLKEGDIVQVSILKEIQNPKGQYFYIGKYKKQKFLLPKELFSNGKPPIGQEIECLVEKINCSGKIFMRPVEKKDDNTKQHFKIKHIEQVHDSLGNPKYKILLQTNDKNMREIISYKRPDTNVVKGKIIGYRKSTPIIKAPSLHSIYVTNSVQEMKILEQRTINNIGTCFIVQDSYNRNHIIELDKFEHYNLQLYSKIDCRILGFDKKHNLKIEPQNPIYKIGETYEFETIRLEESYDELHNPIRILYVKDKLGKEASIVQLPHNYQIQPSVTAKVYRINNGRLYLEYQDKVSKML